MIKIFDNVFHFTSEKSKRNEIVLNLLTCHKTNKIVIL